MRVRVRVRVREGWGWGEIDPFSQSFSLSPTNILRTTELLHTVCTTLYSRRQFQNGHIMCYIAYNMASVSA